MAENILEENKAVDKKYQRARIAHWDKVAGEMDRRRTLSGYYHRRLERIMQFVVPPGQRVLEIGCGQGDLLAALAPAHGVGIDFSTRMLERARLKYPQLNFLEADAHEFNINEKFDFIILSDLINDLWDVQTVLKRVREHASSRTRVIINFYSRLWEWPLGMVRKLGLARPNLLQNWLTLEDISGLLLLADFELIRHWEEIIWPLRTPLLDSLFNRFLAKIWPLRWFALTHFIVARPSGRAAEGRKAPKVSVVVPARNEAGNISRIFSSVPQMGESTELIFVEGNSTDNTYEVIEESIKNSPQSQAVLLRQKGRGKGDAVRLGFEHASGDILMILDADLTVPAEDLPRFYEVLASGKGEFVNGVRLVYPLGRQAMRFFNFLGNKFFSLAFSWLLGQPIKDTLCGTKALWKEDYKKIAANRSYFGDFDPFGDFDLLFGAAKLNLKIVEIPIRYRHRIYGTTNISRWRHGWLLLKMVVFAAKRIKFI